MKIDLPLRTVFNPLDVSTSSEESAQGHVSTSSMYNNDVGICPKCKKQMQYAKIANEDRVFYCAEHRIALPMPNEASLPSAPL